MKYLNESNIPLTKSEVEVLECILSQGSYYEESLNNSFYNSVEEIPSCFFGWEIDETEVPGCRGILSSLVKKGIIYVVYDDGQAYYTKYAFKFDKDSKFYHKLDLTNIEVK